MPWPVAANLSILFTERPLLQRFMAAAEAGFDGVEIQFPYELPAQALRQALDHCGLPLVLMNLPAADLMQGGPGLGGVPDRAAEFEQALQQALRYAELLRPLRVNLLPGRLAEGVLREQALECLVGRLRQTAEAFAGLGIGVVCEAINRHDMPGFLVAGSQELDQLLQRVGDARVQAQLDLYHMARMGERLPDSIARLAGRIGHVQFADCPGRGEPGSGGLDFVEACAALRAAGYQGWLAAEYRPSGPQHSPQAAEFSQWARN